MLLNFPIRKFKNHNIYCFNLLNKIKFHLTVFLGLTQLDAVPEAQTRLATKLYFYTAGCKRAKQQRNAPTV